MLHNRSINSSTQIGMMVRHDAGLISDPIVYVLYSVFTKELVAGSKWHLNNGC